MTENDAGAVRSIPDLVQRACGVALSALLASVYAYGGEPAPVSGTVPATTLVLRGAINQSMVEQFDAAVAERDIRTVRIASHEGEIVHALKIAEGMVASNMDVEVGVVCVGPCAHYILIAGRNRRIEEGSLVAFSVAGTGIAAIGALLGEDVPADFQSDLHHSARELATTEERLYRQRGASSSLLLDSLLAMQPQCVIFRRGPEREAAGWSLHGMTYNMWVPTRKQLTAAGVELEGYWPRSRREMARLATRSIRPEEAAQRIRFGDEDHLRRQRGRKYSFEDIRNCALEEDPAVAEIPGS
jgi:hypothetical protein